MRLLRGARLRDERGVMVVLVAIALPLLLAMGAIVISVSNWYTHAKHLQTKVDAAAFAGGGVWGFPCGPDIDTRIEEAARLYVGDHTPRVGPAVTGSYNPQVGGVDESQMFVTLNQSEWWDDGFKNIDFTSPAGSVCEAKTLDVKATENDTPLLFGVLPFWPDIKRKARVQIEEVRGLSGLLPIALRVPKPVSAAAVFYDESDESDGDVLAVRYFKEQPAISGLPSGLSGWSTLNAADAGSWATIPSLPATTGVAVAMSFRPACGTPGTVPPCFEDSGFATVDDLCNQGAGTQVVECFYGTGSWPSQSVRSGLHFIRGYPEGNAGVGPPQLRGAWLQNLSCEANGYFNSGPVGACQASLSVKVDLGSVIEDLLPSLPGPPLLNQETRNSENVEVRYKLVRSDGSTFCDYGVNCELAAQGGSNSAFTYSTEGTNRSPHLPLRAGARAHAIALQIRVRKSSVEATPDPGSCGVALEDFNDNCRWFYTGNGLFSLSVPPTDAQILAAPVQRAFMGNIDVSGPVKWLRLTQDAACDGSIDAGDYQDGPAATHASNTPACFYVDMGLKGGLAQDQDEPPIVFSEGTGPSQMGSLDCDPNIQQGQILTDGVIRGCSPFYAANKFDTNPLCPPSDQFFTLPKAAPFDDWPPLDCVKTRPTGSMNQLLTGLNARLFNDETNPSCPAELTENGLPVFTPGRNYWHRANNTYAGANFTWDGDTPFYPDDGNVYSLRDVDPRLVRLFFTPYNTFTGSGQETFPVVGFGSFYITGYGRIAGNGNLQIGDPCGDGSNFAGYPITANEPPPDLNTGGSNASGTVVWGHFVKNVVPAAGTTPSGILCRPVETFDPCVAALVE
jgi:hypothetical protein